MKKSRAQYFTLIFVSSLIFCLCFFSCNITPETYWSGDSNVNNRYTPVLNLSEKDAEIAEWENSISGKYKVVIITDVHKGARFYKDGVDEKFIQWLNDYPDRAQIKFALGLGDFADTAKESQMKDYAALVSKIEKFDIKVLNVIGNHDLFFYDGYEIYSEYCYPHTSYYKFYTKNFVWYALDSGSGTLGSRQLANMKAQMSAESKTPIVFTHVPLVKTEFGRWMIPFCFRDVTERNILINFFSNTRIAAFLCGHYHSGGTDTFGNFKQYNFKSFGEFGKWYVLDVDEDAKTVSYTEYSD